MIAIRMCFLAGRFHATPWGHHVNEGVVEFPPSNWRLLRSLTACFYRAFAARAHDEPASFETLKTIIAALASELPQFKLPPAAVAHTRHYDQANGGIKFFDTFVAVNPQAEILWFWLDAELNEPERAMLAELLNNLGTFGRAESWCEAELLNDAETAKIAADGTALNASPLFGGENLNDKNKPKDTIRLLTPKKVAIDELMKSLKLETGAMRGKQKQLEPDAAQWTTYTRPANILTARRAAKREMKQDKMPTVARFALSSTVLPLVADAMPFAEMTRFAISHNRAGNSHSPAFSGKRWDAATESWVKLDGHVHAHFWATDEDGDGKLDHITIYAPCGFNRDDVNALGQVRSVKRPKNLPATEVVLIGLGDKENFGGIPVFGQSEIWRSVTPFALPYFATRGAGKPPRKRDLPESQLVKELINRGFPAPVRVTPIDGYETGKRPLVRWLEFHHERLRKDAQNKKLAGFEIEFEQEIGGAISLGFGCHFGLGLFLPAK